MNQQTEYLEVEESKRVAYTIGRMNDGSKGKCFLLSPSLGDTKEEYRFLTPLLYENGLNTVISMDLRGLGESDVGFSSYNPHDTGRDMVKLMKKLQFDKYIIVGCSMSAASAVYAAAEAPELVESVVLISPFVWDHAMPYGVPFLLNALLNRLSGPIFWSSYYKSLYTKKDSDGLSVVKDINNYAATLQRNLSDYRRITALRGQVFGSKKTCSDRCSSLSSGNLPILSVYGELDPDFPSGINEEMKLMQDWLPKITKQTKILGCGHYPHVESPSEVASAIIAFTNCM
jgi:pimeloyl-ACP methyl ester carboxylesterase